jgi:hypothetical protein
MFSFFRSNPKPLPGHAAAVDDRRSEPRLSTHGDIVLLIETPQPIEVRARLIDQSPSGFRASHMYPALASGQLLRCRLAGVEVPVRVIWNRILEEQMESGFRIEQGPLPATKTLD